MSFEILHSSLYQKIYTVLSFEQNGLTIYYLCFWYLCLFFSEFVSDGHEALAEMLCSQIQVSLSCSCYSFVYWGDWMFLPVFCNMADASSFQRLIKSTLCFGFSNSGEFIM